MSPEVKAAIVEGKWAIVGIIITGLLGVYVAYFNNESALGLQTRQVNAARELQKHQADATLIAQTMSLEEDQDKVDQFRFLSRYNIFNLPENTKQFINFSIEDLKDLVNYRFKTVYPLDLPPTQQDRFYWSYGKDKLSYRNNSQPQIHRFKELEKLPPKQRIFKDIYLEDGFDPSRLDLLEKALVLLSENEKLQSKLKEREELGLDTKKDLHIARIFFDRNAVTTSLGILHSKFDNRESIRYWVCINSALMVHSPPEELANVLGDAVLGRPGDYQKL